MVKIQLPQYVQFPFLFVKFRPEFFVGQDAEGQAGPEEELMGTQPAVPAAVTTTGRPSLSRR